MMINCGQVIDRTNVGNHMILLLIVIVAIFYVYIQYVKILFSEKATCKYLAQSDAEKNGSCNGGNGGNGAKQLSVESTILLILTLIASFICNKAN